MVIEKMKNIKLLVITDTHYELAANDNFMLPELDYDLCILLGDVPKEDIEMLLQYIPAEKMLGVLGNHDLNDTLSAFNIANVHGRQYVSNGVTFTGLERCVAYSSSQDGPTQKESFEICENLPEVDVLLTHESPIFKKDVKFKMIPSGINVLFNRLFKKKSSTTHVQCDGLIMDLVEHYDTHKGNPAINKYLAKNKVRLCLCGHNHINYTEKIGETAVVNLYLINMVTVKDDKVSIQEIKF